MNKFLSRLTIIEDDCRECIASLNYKDDKNDVTHAEAHRMKDVLFFWKLVSGNIVPYADMKNDRSSKPDLITPKVQRLRMENEIKF